MGRASSAAFSDADLGSPPIDADFCAGAEEARERVERFLVEKIVENNEIEGDVHLELSQLGAGSTQVLKAWLFAQGDDVQTVADSIVDAAMEDGGEVGNGKTRYQVLIRGHKGRCAFALEFSPKDDDDANEAPNARGLVAQAMKHTETMTSMMIKVVKEGNQAAKQRETELIEENRTLRSGQVETMQVLAALYDKSHERNLEIKKSEKNEERKDQVAGMVMQGLPTVLNLLAQKAMPAPPPGAPPVKVVQETSSPLEQMVLGFLSSLKPEQLQAFVTTGQLQVDQPQMFGMLEIIKAFQEKFMPKAPGGPTGASAGPAGAPPAQANGAV